MAICMSIAPTFGTGRIGLDLQPQPAHMHIHGSFVEIRVLSPNRLQNVIARPHSDVEAVLPKKK